MKNKNILLVGGEGYIGSVISRYLLIEGYQVKSMDRFLYQNNLCPLNKTGFDKYSFVHCDMLDDKVVTPLVEEADAVVLLAGLVGDPITKKYPDESSEINDRGVKNIIDICAQKSVENLVFISTCSNYGLIQGDELADEQFELNPLSSYAKSKVNAEKYILSLAGNTGMHATILRFATAFGLSPRMRFDLTVSEFIRDLATGKGILVYDAHTWRPYCHVLDFARLIQMVIEASLSDVSFEVFNAGGESNNATKQMIVDKILAVIPDGNVDYQEHGSDPRNYRVNFGKVKSVLGFEPKYSIEDGILELVEALNNHVFDHVEENINFHGNYEINY